MRKHVSTIFVSRTLFYSLLFLTPFIFTTNTNEVFEFPKMYFVYFIGSLLSFLTILGCFWKLRKRLREDTQRELYKTKSTFLTLLMIIFVASFTVSTIFSTHTHTSVWGYFSRFNGGLVSVYVFFGIYLSVLCIKPKPMSVLTATSFTLVPISIYAIMQHFGLGGNWATDTTVRAFSTFGQPNWYGAYCAMTLPITLYLALSSRGKKSKLGWFLLFTLGFTGFWFAYSFSGLIGLATSLIFVSALNFRSTRNSGVWLLGTALLCFIMMVLTPGIFKQKLTDALTDILPKSQSTVLKFGNDTIQVLESNQATQNTTQPHYQPIPATQQPEPSNYLLTDSGFIRKGIWRGTINLWLASPKNLLVGTGPETFPYEFQKIRPAALNYSSEWNFILNKPHNYYLELLAQNGLIGLLMYLAISVMVVLKKHPVLTPALVGLFVTNIFGWPTVSTTLLFWVFVALLTIETKEKVKIVDEEGKGEQFKRRFIDFLTSCTYRRRALTVVRMLVTALLIISYCYLNFQFAKQYLADRYSKVSDKFFDSGLFEIALNFSNKAIKLNPHEPFYYRQRAKTYILATVGQSNDRVNNIKLQAYRDCMKAQELNPQNLATLRGEIPLYYFLALNDISATVKNQIQNHQTNTLYLELARDYYARITIKYPKDIGIQSQVAKYQKMLGLSADYNNTIETIRNLRPDLLNWYEGL